MSSLRQIKEKLQKNWQSWDANNDGKLETRDLASRFDTNNDGIIDEAELEQIADQLSSQLEYSNSLLQELQQSEARQLDLQRELATQKELLRSTASQADQYKSEHSELRRKVKNLQEISDSANKKNKDYRMEIRSIKQELDRTIKENTEAKALLADTADDRERLQRQLMGTKSQVNSTKMDADRAFRGFEEKNQSLEEINRNQKRDLDILKAKIQPLEQERFSTRQKVGELNHSLDEMTARFEAETRLRQAAEKRARENSSSADSYKDKFAQARIEASDMRSKCEMAVQRAAKLEADVSNLEMRLQESDGTAAGLAHQLDKSEHSEDMMRRECDSLAAELKESREELETQKEEYEKRLQMNHENLARELEEARGIAGDGVAEANRRMQQEVEERRRVERQFKRSMEEVLELNKLLKEAQEEATARAAGWTVEREGYEETIRLARLDVAGMRDELMEARGSMDMEKQSLGNSVRDVRQEMLYRGERFADTLAAIQEATAKMRKEAVEMREQQKALTADFNVLRNTTTKVHELSSVGRSAENEIASSISRLFAKIATARDKLEDAQDEIGRAGIQKEEEKARAIMLQESLSRTEHELTMSNRESSLSVSKLKLRVEELSSLLVAEKEARAETDQRLHQAHKSLDASTAAARDLQEQNRNITEALDDTSLRHTSDRQELDSRAIELAAQLKAALQDRDKEMQARLELADRLAMAENMVEERRHALDAAREELNQNRQTVEEMRQKQSAAMNNVGSTHQKYEEQLANMRSVIQTLKESRAELNTQNQVLREELRALESVASRETRGGTD